MSLMAKGATMMILVTTIYEDDTGDYDTSDEI